MKVLLALAIFCALANAQMAGVALVKPNQVVSAAVDRVQQADGSQDIAIDVTSVYADQVGDESMVQVNITVVVSDRAVLFNGNVVEVGVLTYLRFSAMLYEKVRLTGAVISSRSVSVKVQASIQNLLVNGLPALNIQEALYEVDGNRVTEVTVQEAVISLDSNGQEITRVVSQLAIAESRLAPPPTPAAPTTAPSTAAPTAAPTTAAATAAPTTKAAVETTEQPETPEPEQDSPSPNSPNSPDSPFSPKSPKAERQCRFSRWYHRQSFGVRVLVAAAISFAAVLVFYILCRLCVACCQRSKTRAVYLNNVKMHYSPLATDEKKTVVMV